MPHATILPDPEQLRLISLYADGDGIVLTTATSADQAHCPICQHPSRRVHSRYTRLVADLPWQGLSVRVRLHTRRYSATTPSASARSSRSDYPASSG